MLCFFGLKYKITFFHQYMLGSDELCAVPFGTLLYCSTKKLQFLCQSGYKSTFELTSIQKWSRGSPSLFHISLSVELLNSCGLHALKKLYFPGYCKYTVILCSISEKTVLELGRLFPTIPVTNDPTSKPTSCDWSAVLSRVWTSLSSPLFLFFIHLPLALFMCTTEINTLNAFQKGLSENVRCCHNI